MVKRTRQDSETRKDIVCGCRVDTRQEVKPEYRAGPEIGTGEIFFVTNALYLYGLNLRSSFSTLL